MLGFGGGREGSAGRGRSSCDVLVEGWKGGWSSVGWRLDIPWAEGLVEVLV
jgi:hypothetical protein